MPVGPFPSLPFAGTRCCRSEQQYVVDELAAVDIPLCFERHLINWTALVLPLKLFLAWFQVRAGCRASVLCLRRWFTSDNLTCEIDD